MSYLQYIDILPSTPLLLLGTPFGSLGASPRTTLLLSGSRGAQMDTRHAAVGPQNKRSCGGSQDHRKDGLSLVSLRILRHVVNFMQVLKYPLYSYMQNMIIFSGCKETYCACTHRCRHLLRCRHRRGFGRPAEAETYAETTASDIDEPKTHGM